MIGHFFVDKKSKQKITGKKIHVRKKLGSKKCNRKQCSKKSVRKNVIDKMPELNFLRYSFDSRLYNFQIAFSKTRLLTNAQSAFQRFLGEELVVNAPDLVVNGPDLVVNAPGVQLTFLKNWKYSFSKRKF